MSSVSGGKRACDSTADEAAEAPASPPDVVRKSRRPLGPPARDFSSSDDYGSEDMGGGDAGDPIDLGDTDDEPAQGGDR